jgi:multiple sugar transport system ATP-binding protein
MNLIPGEAVGRQYIKTLGVRPEHLRADVNHGDWSATAKVVETLGADTVVYADAEGIGEITVRLPGHMRLKAGERLYLTPEPDSLHLFDRDGNRMEQAQ